MTKESRRALAQINRAMAGLEKGVAKDVESGRISKSRARTMRRVAELIREVVALEKRAGGSSSVFLLESLPAARPRRAGGAKRRPRKR